MPKPKRSTAIVRSDATNRFASLDALLREPTGAIYGDGANERGEHTAKLYRYILWRTWDATLPRVGFVLLNPSTATEHVLDPTLTRCQNFAKRWGAGGMVVANIFALRSTDPAGLKRVDDPVGPDNDAAIAAVLACCGRVVAGWGNHGKLKLRQDRIDEIVRSLPAESQRQVVCFAVTKSGAPKHPLYVAGDAGVTPFERGSPPGTINH